MKNICDNEEEHKARVEAVKAAMPADEKISKWARGSR